MSIYIAYHAFYICPLDEFYVISNAFQKVLVNDIQFFALSMYVDPHIPDTLGNI